MNGNKEKNKKSKTLGIDLRTATKDEIIFWVRDTLKPAEIKKKLYPGFLRLAEKTQDRAELLRLASQTFQKVRALKANNSKEDKNLSVVTEKEAATENNSIKKSNHGSHSADNNFYLNTKKEVDSGELSVNSTRERESFNSTSTKSRNIGRPKNHTSKIMDEPSLSVGKDSIVGKDYKNPLSVWEKIQYYLQHPTELEDLAVLRRLEQYTKKALFIIHVVDVYQVLTVYEAHRKAQEVIGLRMSSRTTVGDLLKDLYFDNYLDLEILPRKNNIEPKLYSVKGFQELYPAKYERARCRYIPRPENHTSNKLDVQNNGRIDSDKNKLESIKEKAKLTSLAQKEGYAEAREEEKEREDKERAAKQEEVVKKHLQLSKNSSPGASFDTQFYLSVQELPKEELERSLRNKPFRTAYDKMLKQKEEMTKEELDDILRNEERRKQEDRREDKW